MTSRLEIWDRTGRLAYLPAALSVRVREVLNGEYYVTFDYAKLAGDDERYSYLIPGNEIRFPSDIENGQRFVIRGVEESDDENGARKSIEAHHVFFEAGRSFYDAYVDFAAAQTVEAMLSQLFAGTSVIFSVSGTFVATDIFDWGEKSRLALLHELRELYGAELSFDNLTLTFAKRKGADNGVEIRRRKNRKIIRRNVDESERVTRLFGYGKDGLTIEGLGGRSVKYIDSTYHDPTRPFEAAMQWGDIEDQAALLTAMQAYLAANELPHVYYEVETVGLGPVSVGDTIRVYDDKLGYDVDTRLFEYERYPFDKTVRPRLVLGNFRERSIPDYLLTLRKNQRSFQRLASRWNTELRTEQSQLAQAQSELSTYVDGAFTDGIISAAEAQAIAEHLRTLAKEKADTDAEYVKIYGSSYLTDTAVKAALQSAKTAYDTSYSACVGAINAAISDGQTTASERTAVDSAFTDLSTKQGALRQALEDAIRAITVTAETNAKTYADELYAQTQQQVDELAGAQDTFESYVDDAFRDAVISEAEAKAIAQNKAQLAKEKADVDAEYTKVYANLYLTNATLKTALQTAKTQYDTSYTALISAIDSVIADNAVTAAERTNVDGKFADLTAKLSTLRQALQDCASYIGQNTIDKAVGRGIQSGGIIRLENRTHTQIRTTLTSSHAGTATALNVVSTAAFPASGSGYVYDANATFGNKYRSFSYTGKTATTLTGVTGLFAGDTYISGAAVYMWTQPVADIVVTAMEVIMPNGDYKIVPETRFNAQTLGVSAADFDGWEFRYLYVSAVGTVVYTSAGTGGGQLAYPPDPPEGSIRIGYMLVGIGAEDPDGNLSMVKSYESDGYPAFKERVYHDTRYRDERSVRVEGGDVAFGGTPYGAQTLNVSVAANSYQTYYISVGTGRRSVNLSISLDDGSGYDNYSYGAQMTIGRKAANNADGLGKSVWASYTDADGNRGHVSGQRNTSPYGIHILSPRVWNRSYTMLYDADLMPNPTDASVIALKLTFRNYGGSSESFALKLNWHAL
ncbi:phage tail spike protein [Paenibacillus xanthanilyticus]|uniref:Phage tail spike protein n=1 Tax=Paenibacillus xanthanilyticus TaxID=1783531 RepID=A0ABV8KC21_9BACL